MSLTNLELLNRAQRECGWFDSTLLNFLKAHVLQLIDPKAFQDIIVEVVSDEFELKDEEECFAVLGIDNTREEEA